MFDHLDTLLGMQLAVYPESAYHRQESLVWKKRAEARRMYEHLSGEVRFREPSSIKRWQIHRHISKWLGCEAEPESLIERSDAISRQMGGWRDRFHIQVSMPPIPGLKEGLRQDRARSRDTMASVFENWKSSEARFKEVFRKETKAFGQAVIRATVKLAQKLAACPLDNCLVGLDVLAGNPATELWLTVYYACCDYYRNEDEALKATLRYLENADFSEVPFVRISSLLLAGLARRAANGQKAPTGSMWTDIDMVSVLLPYCDAVFVDREIGGLLSEGGITGKLGCQTKVFSRRSYDDFLAYLREIEHSATDKHIETLRQVYGEDYATPYTTMYDDD